MINPGMIIEDIFGIDNSFAGVECRLEYAEHGYLRYIFHKPLSEIGVYVLYDGNEIVYIGYSKKLYTRIRSHCTSKRIIWDKYEKYIIGCELMSRFIEENLIKYYKPKYNVISRSNHYIHNN